MGFANGRNQPKSRPAQIPNVSRNIMKHFVLILSFFIYSLEIVKANKIDSLKTGKDVEKFIATLFLKIYNENYHTFSLKKPDSVKTFIPCDSSVQLGSEIWNKIDFNSDGLTDLFAIIYQRDTLNSDFPRYTIYVVIDQGNNKFQLNKIPEYFLLNCYSIKQIFVKGYPTLLYRHYRTDYTVDTLPGIDTTGGMNLPLTKTTYFETGRTDTLIYKFGGFIELNTLNKKIPPIESIYYEMEPCFGSCPIFSINIFKDRSAYYVRHESLEEKYGNFRTNIEAKNLSEIFKLIEYLNVFDLADNYYENATDLATCNLIIKFSDGSIKRIRDYGLQGTLGLIRLYNLLYDLRSNQKWK